MLAFVTVGSTRFDSLVQAILSSQVLSRLLSKGYSNLIIQCGISELVEMPIGPGVTSSFALQKDDIDIEIWRFKPSLEAEYGRADLVISHAGSGTILDVLRLGKPLIVVPNPTLLDNHQEELASALAALGYLNTSTVLDLPQTIDALNISTIVPFPPLDGTVGFPSNVNCNQLNEAEPAKVVVLSSHMPPRASVITAVINGDPRVHEDTHVHEVYNRIASHFSSTRYKPWPIVAEFLSRLPTGWVGLDSGTGNGKYLPLPLERPGALWTIGLDRSRNLLRIAKIAGGETVREVVWGDVLGHGWRRGAFDYTISIATIHHLATYERRKLAIKRLIQCVSPAHGRILIYVWAVEQDEFSKRSIPTNSHRGLVQGPASTGQDVFVPWVLSQQAAKPCKATANLDKSTPVSPEFAEQMEPGPDVVNRYYHMFAHGELVGLASSAATELGLKVGVPSLEKTDSASVKTNGVTIVQDGWERSNYYVELQCWEC